MEIDLWVVSGAFDIVMGVGGGELAKNVTTNERDGNL